MPAIRSPPSAGIVWGLEYHSEAPGQHGYSYPSIPILIIIPFATILFFVTGSMLDEADRLLVIGGGGLKSNKESASLPD